MRLVPDAWPAYLPSGQAIEDLPEAVASLRSANVAVSTLWRRLIDYDEQTAEYPAERSGKGLLFHIIGAGLPTQQSPDATMHRSDAAAALNTHVEPYFAFIQPGRGSCSPAPAKAEPRMDRRASWPWRTLAGVPWRALTGVA